GLDLTMPQLKVLMLLGQEGSAPVSLLAQRMKVSPPNVTGILDRLEQQNLVRRTAFPGDRRVVRVVLTEEGNALLQQLQNSGQEALPEILENMRPEDRKALSQGLKALIE